MCLYLVENPRNKEFMDSELARGRISKFYWLVALGSRAWVLVSSFDMGENAFVLVYVDSF